MNIRDRIAESPFVLFDGAIGTQLYARGIAKGHCYDELNLSMPEIILEVHQDYMAAGAQVITTNTFGANRFILEEYYGLGDKTREINYYGARLAAQAARQKAAVAGSIGPVTRPLDTRRRPDQQDMAAMFREQIEALLEGGVDLLIFETFASTDELHLGIEVAREINTQICLIAEASFPNNGLTIYGKNPYEVALGLEALQVDCIGSNCGTGPQSVFQAVKKMGVVTDRELAAMPNAGQAQFSGGKFSYPFNPEYLARYGVKFLESGIKVIGGCCGTTPRHISLLKQYLEETRPGPRKKGHVAIAGQPQTRKEEAVTSKLKGLLEGRWTIAMEIDPPKDGDIDHLLKRITSHCAHVDIINISDSPMAKPRMSPISAGKLLKDALGKEIIVHYTCRDRNILGLQSDLIGASALGLENVLALGGDPPSIGDYPFATGVYDLTAEGLVEMMSALNRGVDLLGNHVGKQTHFYIGTGVGVQSDETHEIERVRRKIEKGAHFLITQPVFDVEKHRHLLENLRGLGVPLMVSIMPLVSFHNAEYIHYEVPGISIPDMYLKRMEGKQGREGEQEGVAIAREILAGLRPLANGVLIIPPLNRVHLVDEILCEG